MLNVVCELLNRLEKLRELLSYKDNELFTLRTKILNYEDQLRAVSHSKKMREEGIKALIHADRQRIHAIKAIRSYTGMGLKEARDFVDRELASK